MNGICSQVYEKIEVGSSTWINNDNEIIENMNKSVENEEDCVSKNA